MAIVLTLESPEIEFKRNIGFLKVRITGAFRKVPNANSAIIP